METFHRVMSCIFNQQLERLNLNYLEYFGAAALITFRLNEKKKKALMETNNVLFLRADKAQVKYALHRRWTFN